MVLKKLILQKQFKLSLEGDSIIKVDKKLDCQGLYCPEPVYRTRMELDEMQVGETLEVMADDPAAESDIKSLVKNLEQEILYSSQEGNITRIIIKKVK